ncbi:50S ribosomal protein L23 [Candidatus Gracilibacteria bacterium]|nr:50S ribosomal protein L23 [Candidatus Gracilibacteria bacterium]
MTDYKIILRPLITEKNTNLMELNQYCFEVDREASKPQIKRAIENIFSVSVTKVRTINMRGKQKRRGTVLGHQRDWKKAIVTLADGDRIELFES